MALPSVGLVRKLVGVLEALEKLAVYTHEPPGQMLNLQSIQKRIRFALERAPGATDLRDCAGRTLRAEPLASVDGLEKFLNGIVSQDFRSRLRYIYMCGYVQCIYLMQGQTAIYS